MRRLDVRDAHRVADAASGADGIFHLAALGSVPRSFHDPDATFATNVDGTLAVLAAARRKGVRRVVLASSSSVYGANGAKLRRETDRATPLSPYAHSKLAAEHHCLAAHHSGGPEIVCLRYFNVYGPRQDPASPYAAAIPRFITRLLAGERPAIYGDGEQTRDFTYVADIAAGTAAAMTAPAAAGHVINLGTGIQTSVGELVSLLRKLSSSRLKAEHAPARAGEVQHSAADIALARQLLAYTPTWTLEEGLCATIAWHQARPIRRRSHSNLRRAQAPDREASLPEAARAPSG